MIVLGVTFVFVGVLLVNLALWPRVRTARTSNAVRDVAVLIPARNEQANIAACLDRVLAQDETVAEILVYDDHSTDRTADIVRDYAARDPRVRLVTPEPLPPGWCGKNHACWQLANAAESDWLLFLDADARLQPNAVARLRSEADTRNVTFLSAWPGLVQESFWERACMPLLNFAVLSLFPAPLSLLMPTWPSLGLAHGACILVECAAYRRVDGHRGVRNEIFEDTRLARAWRASGERGLCLDGQAIVTVRMYDSLAGIWSGFTKNFYPAFQRDAMFWLFLSLHVTAFISPFVLIAIAPFVNWSVWPFAVAAALVLLGRLALAIRFRYPIWPVLFHPFMELGLIALGLRSRRRFRRPEGVEWKGRVYSAGTTEDPAA